MNVYKLNGLAKRGTSFALAVALLSASIMTALPSIVSADALNPLTERTLLLSSSSPGYHYLDAAGNSTYAAPGSGPNGKQSGETFSFKVSTNSTNAGFGAKNTPIKGFSFQYCTTAAGNCTAPGNDVDTDPGAGVTRVDDSTHSDLNVVTSTPSEVTVKPTAQANGSSLVARNNSAGNFGVYVAGTLDTGWVMETSNSEVSATNTLKNNYIVLRKTGGTDLKPAAGTQIDIVFYATDSNYITNPGYGAFFVKINDYDTATASEMLPTDDTHIIDGGVTVANVMTDSIEIQTKVLETMSFSVGTINPDLVDPTDVSTGGVANATHGPCDPVKINRPIKLGNTTAEDSLEVNTAYDGTSWWRLSSNSSNGASVYYSGYTLSNTVGDQIDPIWSGTDVDGVTPGVQHWSISQPGREQFGLAFDQSALTLQDSNGATAGGTADNPNTLDPLVSEADYANGAGTLDNSVTTPKFAFNPASASTPELLATESTSVVGCTTGHMRYVGNIGASTPAGIYASKVNYLAAPQY